MYGPGLLEPQQNIGTFGPTLVDNSFLFLRRIDRTFRIKMSRRAEEGVVEGWMCVGTGFKER